MAKSSLEVDPSVLISSFLVDIFKGYFLNNINKL